MWPELAAHSWADLALQKRRHQNLERPTWQLCHLRSAKELSGSACCCQLCFLLWNGSDVVSIFNPCCLQGFHMVTEDMPLCSDKSKPEALSKWLLGENNQVPYFGGLQNCKLFPLSAGQSHIDLKHLLRIIFTLSSPLETLAHKQLTQQTWQCHPWIISSFSHEIHRAIPGKGCRATLPSLIKAFFSFAASESGESFVRRGPTTISGTIIYIYNNSI